MPLPKPTKDETEQDFIARFMSDDTAKEEFPEAEQRTAVAKERFTATNSVEPDPTEPQTRKITINSKTSGRYKMRTVGGAKHMITEMVPIVGDTVMKGLLYPNAEVIKSFNQFTNLPAPAGHPTIEGQKVSAFHPMAINAFNVGGFTRNPRMDGKKVVTEFWLNTDVADRTDDGKELIRRIKEGDQVGVSTGLDARIVSSNGVGEDGVKYRAKLSDFQFDHVALLLNEEAAGSHVGTELITNDEGEEILVGEVVNASVSEFMTALAGKISEKFTDDTGQARLVDAMLDESAAIFERFNRNTGDRKIFKIGFTKSDNGVSLADNPIEVTEKREFVPVQNAEEENDMELTIENTTAFLVEAGKKVVDPSEVITPEQVTALDTYAENKEAFEGWQAEQTSVLNTKREECMEASGLKEADVANLGIDAMQTIIDKCSTTVNNAARGGGHVPASERSEDANEFAADYMSGKTKEKE